MPVLRNNREKFSSDFTLERFVKPYQPLPLRGPCILCLWFFAQTSKYREHLSLIFVVFISTLEAAVLKVIRIFLFQPVDNDKLMIL